MKNRGENLTQAQVLSQELTGVGKDVTKADRDAFLADNKLGKTTLSNYLNGKVRDNDTAATILHFMRERIARRYETAGVQPANEEQQTPIN